MIFAYVITLVLLIAYAILLVYYRRSFNSMPESPTVPADYTPTTKITILIPARNEAENIGACIRSVLAQHYPENLVQCIIIDDHSEDATTEIVRSFSDHRVELLSLSTHINNITNSYKKKAIETGISKANGEFIVTTDADCIAGPGWLRTIAFHYEKSGAELIAGPVKFKRGRGLLYLFQSLDFLSLQGITAASVNSGFHSMCNGANLGYTKKAFLSVEGFKGIDSLASGDDMLLMHKISQRFPGKIQYLKSKTAIVSTAPALSIKEFLQQRIRWASKARIYEDKSVFWVLLLVYVLNLFMLLIIFSAFFSVSKCLWALALVAIKTSVEWPFMYVVAGFFGEQSKLKFFPLFQPFHIAYTVIAGSFGQFGSYAWKGRRVH